MNNITASGKRLVSKGEYVRAQAGRFGLGMSGSGAIILGCLCGLAAFIMIFLVIIGFIYAVLHDFWAFVHHEGTSMVSFLTWSFALIAAAWGLLRWGVERVKKASTINVVPITRANTADLPANDSLVRASSQPAQAQEGVLLRASGETQDKCEEQLLRASAG